MSIERIILTDDTGRWFLRDSATEFGEDSNWDGNNHISVATGSQWEHEELYYTESGLWILHSWSQWQGSVARYEEISGDSAVAWLARNNRHDDGLDSLPSAVRGQVLACLADLEV